MSSGSKRHRNSLAESNIPLVEIEIFDNEPQTSSKSRSKRRKAVPRVIDFTLEGSLTPGSPSKRVSALPVIDAHPPVAGKPAEDPTDVTSIDVPTEGVPNESKKNSNHYLREWLLESCDSYVEVLYNCDAPPKTNNCDSCLRSADHLYRCTTCLGMWSHCASCLLSTHRFIPTHRTEVWDGMVWIEKPLANIGLVLYLGHQGQPCSNHDSEPHSSILCGDLTGFCIVNVQFCTHANSLPKPQQLLAAGLFPCSDKRPQSAFTLTLLDTYNIFATLGRTSAHKFYSVLERVTNPGFPDNVDDRYRELMLTHRKFLHVLNLRRAGHKFRRHPLDVHPGDQALDCIACPRPGFNFEWSEVHDNERAFVSYDGNFRSVRKLKKVGSGDISLSDGLAYFVPKGPYKAWTETEKGSQRTEKPACDNHKAGNDTGVRWVGQDVTGIGAFTCTSHSCFIPRGMADFFKGERFIYADYAFASLVHYLTKRGYLAFGMTYDVWCHWITNFRARAANLPSDIKLPDDLDLVGGVPKWHLIGHIISCYVRYSLDHMQHVGRMEGEGPERVWSYLNEHSSSTSEQGPGVRTDNLNNVAGQWNFEKMIRMVHALPPKFKEAKRMFQKQLAVHEELSQSLPAASIQEWEQVSLEPVQGPDGKWTSPLMDSILTSGSYQSEIQAGREAESSTAHVAGKKPGITRWISGGIELEHSMHRIAEEAKEIGNSPSPAQANSLNTKRMSLRGRVLEHHKAGLLYMTGLEEPDHPNRKIPTDSHPEFMELGLPSSYRSETLAAAELTSLAEQEIKLRRGMCNDSLESTKRLLGAKALTIKNKNNGKQPSGRTTVTRAEADIRQHSKKVSKSQWRYNNSRNALIRLGLSAKDSKVYLELTNEDLKTLKSFLEDDSRGVGQGYKAISWIWRSTLAPNIDDWQIHALQTEWFRSRERYKRWREQLVLVKREMIMTIRGFRKKAEVWEWKARFAGAHSGMRVYATKSSRFYTRLAHNMLLECRAHLQDDIVTLEWSNDWLSANDKAHLKPIWEGMEEEMFGEGGYQQFLAELTREDQVESNASPDENRDIAGTFDSSRASHSQTGAVAQNKQTSSVTLRSGGRTIAKYNQSKATNLNQTPPRRARQGASSPSGGRLVSHTNGSPTAGKKKDGEQPESQVTDRSAPSASPSSQSSSSHSEQPSPTFPLTRVSELRHKLIQRSPTRGKANAANRAYVELRSPKVGVSRKRRASEVLDGDT